MRVVLSLTNLTASTLLPAAPIVYGGVFPTYHGKDILTAEAAIDIVVRGEGEWTSIALARALETGAPLAGVPGLFYRECSQVLERFRLRLKHNRLL